MNATCLGLLHTDAHMGHTYIGGSAYARTRLKLKIKRSEGDICRARLVASSSDICRKLAGATTEDTD